MKKKARIVLLFFNTLYASIYAFSFHLSPEWYPSTKSALNAQLATLKKQAQENYNASIKPGSVRAIIAPHAGISYSGIIASSVYRLAAYGIRRVIILAPDHSGSLKGVAFPSFSRYQLPNGSLTLDGKCLRNLAQHNLFTPNNDIFQQEHALEMQLPFIRYYIPHAQIVPLIIGSITCLQADQITQHIAECITDHTLVVVSTDFIHYGKKFGFTPFEDNHQLKIRALDSQLVQLIEKGECIPFEQFISQTNATICGKNPIMVLLALLHNNAFGPLEPRLIAYATSAKNSDDDSVSYVGMLFTKEKLSSLPIANQLTQQEKKGLSKEGHDILNHLYDTNFDATLLYPIKSFGVRQKRGAFATLKKGNALRGCIGHIFSSKPIYQTIKDITREAALHDPRFSPVTQKEISDLNLKLSILSPLHSIKTTKEIILGKHGIILEYGNKSALFLPEVAKEMNWNLAETLSQLSQKAGLPSDAWQKKGVTFKIFETADIY